MTLAEEIDALLPQTQCTQCGYQGCLPYAEALAAGEAEINRCPPGGDAGIARLAALLGKPVIPLDPTCGQHLPHRVAVIDAQNCIGCAKCLKVCPTDAIIGANKYLHSVMPQFCTGCGLCIPPCPVDCIDMVADPLYPALPDANPSRIRFHAHQARQVRDQQEREAALAAREATVLKGLT
ncbi:MAG: RnfABCDGE type electron transport complex subunit B [Betaproteobacteria bacterium]|nr:RnfABCDGE type electron transport complex subunit B [Betaproteobacteria bacterium]